jgi:hypothetical protein
MSVGQTELLILLMQQLTGGFNIGIKVEINTQPNM